MSFFPDGSMCMCCHLENVIFRVFTYLVNFAEVVASKKKKREKEKESELRYL